MRHCIVSVHTAESVWSVSDHSCFVLKWILRLVYITVASTGRHTWLAQSHT